jgi:hypothetical protein
MGGPLDRASRLTRNRETEDVVGQGEEIPIAGHYGICRGRERKIKKNLVIWIPVFEIFETWERPPKDLCKRQKIDQELFSIYGTRRKLRLHPLKVFARRGISSNNAICAIDIFNIE